MALLKTADANMIRQRLQAELIDDVTIKFFDASAAGLSVPGWECEYCPMTQQLLEEVVALDARLKLEVHSVAPAPDTGRPLMIERVPAIVIGRNDGSRIRFYGIPSGFEFGALMDDLVAVSRNDSGLASETRGALAALTHDVHVQVFVTPTCPYCPRASRLAHAMALESPRVRADVIEATEFPSLADKYGVFGVPKVVLNETQSFEGALPEAAFLKYVVAAAAEQTAHMASPVMKG
jgi:glutaredoxin-like protein